MCVFVSVSSELSHFHPLCVGESSGGVGNSSTQAATTAGKAAKHVRVDAPAGNATTTTTTAAAATANSRGNRNGTGGDSKAAAAATRTAPGTPDDDDDGYLDPEKRVVTMEPSARSFGGPSSSRRDRSEAVQITDALVDVRIKYHINPNELGHGHYGVVRKCMDRETKAWYAIKSIRKAKVSKIEVLKREIQILREVRHPNIIELVDVFEDDKYLHLVTELCTGGELFDRIIAKTQSPEGHYSERDAAALIRDILDAIAYCHSKGIVHRDLKPENFLFSTEDDSAPIKIIDFGLSRHNDANQGIMKTKVGKADPPPSKVMPRLFHLLADKFFSLSFSLSLSCLKAPRIMWRPKFYGENTPKLVM
jgi:tRNA A-37 threonylcarbamoyl transferase component Bud32